MRALDSARPKHPDPIQIDGVHLKDVCVYGLHIRIESTINWLTIDEDGSVYGYFCKPVIGAGKWCSDGLGEMLFLFNTRRFTGDWKQSLREV